MLLRVLASFTNQSLAHDRFDIVVIDDGSTDETPDVCSHLSRDLDLHYVRVDHQGISAAKNTGMARATGEVVLFADDDGLPDARLLEEHLHTHLQHPEPTIAVLGFTDWHSALTVTPIMKWVNDIGFMLMGYEDLRHGAIENYEFFWGGRSSCKRDLLLEHGGFDPAFTSITEDIELGYRLSKLGLRVLFNRHAICHMLRPVTFDDFCRRCERIGEGLFLFASRHSDPVVQDYCRRNLMDPLRGEPVDVSACVALWRTLEQDLLSRVDRVRLLESTIENCNKRSVRDVFLAEVYHLYWWTFNACRIKGVAVAAAAIGGTR
jgi:glycosyltransferase involved in cell wall biosynthesis